MRLIIYICLFALTGCAATVADLKRNPISLSVTTESPLQEFHQCLDRWFDEGGFRINVRYDEYVVFIGAAPLMLVTFSDGVISAQNYKLLTTPKRFRKVVVSCAENTDAAPPDGFWGLAW